MTDSGSTLTAMQLPTTEYLRELAVSSLTACGVDVAAIRGDGVAARTPVTGGDIMTITPATADDVVAAIDQAHEAFVAWRSVPAPVRGALVKRFGTLLTEHKTDIANLIGIEVGKVYSEALGEVQEMIDICDFAVGLSRQLDGKTMPSERPGHRLMETWLPLGPVGVISAFNFPAAVWSWNTAVALVCGDTVIWKCSPATPLVSYACSALLDRAAREMNAPANLNTLVVADVEASQVLVESPRVPLISATGSERMGREVAPVVAARFGRSLLELGGNNAAIVTPSADLDIALRGIVFAAAGTAGQRCTTMRRVIAHADIVDELVQRISIAYSGLAIGDPFADGTLVGPLIDGNSYSRMRGAIDDALAQGGELVVGGDRIPSSEGAYYVRPALIRMPQQTDIVKTETFAPILYVMSYTDITDAIAMHNDVPQGLSSSIFTTNQREAELFMTAEGSDCGIVNVNIGTSGAEIGGAFGGEKSTGGGRESGSDAWHAYMRRTTNTINYSNELPLAQGVNFG